MIKIALTGIIGSGKTTAANYFKSLGIPIFIADDCAKELMTTDYELKTQMVNLLGELTYVEDKLNREFISDQIFNNKNLLASVNNLIHPRVQKAFDVWVNKQNSKYVVYEAALIFENNSDNMFDKIICIKTPLNIIHKRIISRKMLSTKSPNLFNLILLEFLFKNKSPPRISSKFNTFEGMLWSSNTHHFKIVITSIP